MDVWITVRPMTFCGENLDDAAGCLYVIQIFVESNLIYYREFTIILTILLTNKSITVWSVLLFMF